VVFFFSPRNDNFHEPGAEPSHSGVWILASELDAPVQSGLGFHLIGMHGAYQLESGNQVDSGDPPELLRLRLATEGVKEHELIPRELADVLDDVVAGLSGKVSEVSLTCPHELSVMRALKLIEAFHDQLQLGREVVTGTHGDEEN
jgi:hypothetical protein